ncbi:MAG: hypothetical protein R3185_05635, partial [Candidatus Thermoplasmatota archaeon]|nr:hypothetical protein [Candidatus Thermoplasmatota archaeon]
PQLGLLAMVGGLTVVGVAACRYLVPTWARRTAMAGLAVALGYLIITSWELMGFLLPMILVAGALARDLWDPALGLRGDQA